MSQDACLYQRRMPAETWPAVVEEIHKKQPFAYLYFESATQIELTAYQPPQPHWSEGRAFGNGAELRWSRRLDGQVELLLISDAPLTLPAGWQPCPDLADSVSGSPEAVVLRGVSRRHTASPYPDAGAQTAPKAWTESRIPRPLIYPVDEAHSYERWVKLTVKRYFREQRLVLTRMIALEGTSDETPI